MTRPLGDWQLREGLVKGEYASDVILLGWLPGHTRCTVAIDLGEGLGIQNDRGQQTLTSCQVARRVKYLRAFKRTKLQRWLLSLGIKIDKGMYLQVHLFGVMFHGGPVRLGEEWGGPSEIKVIFTGVNPTSVLEDTCQSLVWAIFFQQYGTNPIINHAGVG